MLSFDYIRENKDKVLKAAQQKNRQIDLDAISSLDDKRRELIKKSQTLREERNSLASLKDPE